MSEYQAILNNFKERVDGVNKLLRLDDLILGTTLSILEDRQSSLRNCGIENAHQLGENALSQLKSIKNNESLKPGYKLIYNQCVVLLVSYFSSSIHDFFNCAATELLKNNIPKKFKGKDLKFTLEELKSYDFDLNKDIGAIISEKFDISFQDMGSISRAMKDILCLELPWDKTINNIITMQACRHAIAHAGEIADEKLINQLRKSSERDIQKDIDVGRRVQFTPDKVTLGGEEMLNYLSNLISKLDSPA